MIFEGEYLNRQKNGKGKEYNSEGILIFEGEYLNGQKNGKGKEYDKKGIVIFEGEYKNNHKLKGCSFIAKRLEFEGEYFCDKKWTGNGYDERGNITYTLNQGSGTVKEYNNDGKKIFEGKYSNGIRNGNGKEYNYNRLIFEGEYLNGKRNGRGKEYDYDKLIFEGEYLSDKRWNGKGYNEKGNEVYEIKQGSGTERRYNSDNQLIYQCQYLNGEKNGMEVEYYYNSIRIERNYLKGKLMEIQVVMNLIPGIIHID